MKYFNLENNEDFERLYSLYYPKLVRFSKEYILSRSDAENIVQDIFLTIWEQRKKLTDLENVNAFLFRLTKNRCIDFLRRKVLMEEKQRQIQDVLLKEYQLKLYSIEQFDENNFTEEDIETILQNAIRSLPDKCREIFILSRLEGLKHHEIAEKLNISPSTVNNQISLALKKLKEILKNHLPLFVFLTI